MIDIPSKRGYYSYDPETERVFLNDELIPSSKVSPIYSYYGKRHFPQFAGLLLKEYNVILSLSGKENPVTEDENLIQ